MEKTERNEDPGPNQKSTPVKLTGLKLSILPSLMRMLMKRGKMKPLPTNPGLEATLSEGDPSPKKPTQPRSFHKFAFDCLQATRAGWTRTDEGGRGDCGYRVLCCGLAKISATVILPEKLAC